MRKKKAQSPDTLSRRLGSPSTIRRARQQAKKGRGRPAKTARSRADDAKPAKKKSAEKTALFGRKKAAEPRGATARKKTSGDKTGLFGRKKAGAKTATVARKKTGAKAGWFGRKNASADQAGRGATKSRVTTGRGGKAARAGWFGRAKKAGAGWLGGRSSTGRRGASGPGWFARRTAEKKKRRAQPEPMTSHHARQENAVPGRWRIRGILAIFALGACVLVGRAAQLQLVEGDKYGDISNGQADRSFSIPGKRGVITDRHGRELAITVDVDSVVANPRMVDASAVASKLAPILSRSKASLEKKLSSKKYFTYLSRRVDAATSKRVRDAKLRGVWTQPEPKRFYANVGLASHILGFTNLDGAGKAGVEMVLDEHLRGQSWVHPGMRDALGNKVYSEGFRPHAELEGADVTLTIDRQIQYAAETAVEAAATKYKAKSAVAVVMQPQTGEVLALASYPTFNPNNLNGTTPRDRTNRAVSAIYEPGSTLKMITISAAIDEGLLDRDATIYCEDGAWRVGGRTIHDSNHKYGNLTVTEIMKLSSNICSAKIGFLLERQRLHDWLFRFGFGEKTGIELPGELRGLIRPANKWRDIALANIAFGQGIAVTPLQIVQAASTIANDGVMVRPRIVKRIVDKAGTSVALDPAETRRVLKPETARTLRQMMVEVTKDGGTAVTAAVPGFEVAGKTGTAQKIDPVTKAYSHELYTASFVGLVPAEKPEVAILVLVDEPKGSIYGGVVAAPAFVQIAAAALAARDVYPKEAADKEAFLASFKEAPKAKSPDSISTSSESEKWLESNEIDGVPTEEAGLEIALSDRAQALLGVEAPAAPEPAPAGAGRTPNFVGLSVMEVLNRSADVRCDPVVNGTGRVVRQKPARGAPLQPGSTCEVWLQPEGVKPKGSGA
ncbi:MAG: penicillin-binding transpeptidase domain-containing protein [Deltaproteobacteria bacterium]